MSRLLEFALNRMALRCLTRNGIREYENRYNLEFNHLPSHEKDLEFQNFAPLVSEPSPDDEKMVCRCSKSLISTLSGSERQCCFSLEELLVKLGGARSSPLRPVERCSEDCKGGYLHATNTFASSSYHLRAVYHLIVSVKVDCVHVAHDTAPGRTCICIIASSTNRHHEYPIAQPLKPCLIVLHSVILMKTLPPLIEVLIFIDVHSTGRFRTRRSWIQSQANHVLNQHTHSRT